MFVFIAVCVVVVEFSPRQNETPRDSTFNLMRATVSPWTVVPVAHLKNREEARWLELISNWPRKKSPDFGGNPDHVTLGLVFGLG